MSATTIAPQIFHRPADATRMYWGPGDLYKFLVTGEESGGAYFAMEAIVPPGGGPPPHIHRNEDETFYVLEGTVTIFLDGRPVAATPGDFVHVPRGTVHNFRNTAESPSRILVGFTPGGIEGFFREAGRLATDDGAAPPVDEDEILRTMASAQKHGLEAVAFDG